MIVLGRQITGRARKIGCELGEMGKLVRMISSRFNAQLQFLTNRQGDWLIRNNDSTVEMS